MIKEKKNYKEINFISPNNYWSFKVVLFQRYDNKYNIYATKESINNTYCGESIIKNNINYTDALDILNNIQYKDISQLKYEIY